jgi:hypothetical protein
LKTKAKDWNVKDDGIMQIGRQGEERLKERKKERVRR